MFSFTFAVKRMDQESSKRTRSISITDNNKNQIENVQIVNTTPVRTLSSDQSITSVGDLPTNLQRKESIHDEISKFLK